MMLWFLCLGLSHRSLPSVFHVDKTLALEPRTPRTPLASPRMGCSATPEHTSSDSPVWLKVQRVLRGLKTSHQAVFAVLARTGFIAKFKLILSYYQGEEGLPICRTAALPHHLRDGITALLCRPIPLLSPYEGATSP